MSEGRALINIGELSRPATVLIEKISDALGGVFKPWQIRRVAQANAEAEKISAASRIEITELEQRALGRFLVEEAQKQRNIEAITQQALPLLNEESDPRNVDNDWIANFFDKSRIVSDNEMQILWARILAGEANAPGQYSKRSVNLLSSFDKRDAQLFASLCGFVWDIGGFVPLILGHHEPIYEAGGITFDVLRHLEAIGLVTFQSLAGYAKQLLPEQFVVSYFGSRFMIETGPRHKQPFPVGVVLFTQAGHELASISGALPIQAFQEYVLSHWRHLGLVVKEVESENSDSNQAGAATDNA